MKQRMFVAIAILMLTVVGCGGGSKKPGGDISNPDMGMKTGDDSSDMGGTDNAGRGTVDTQDLTPQLQTIYFDFDKYNLRSDAREALDHNYQILHDDMGMSIVIEGHCDERGTDEYNLALGERRAKAAKDYLVKLGIDPSRITIISYGEERPAAMGHSEQAWAQNRRGEFETQ